MKPLFLNGRGTYAIIDKKGKVLERFRVKNTASNRLRYWKDKFFDNDLEVIKLK